MGSVAAGACRSLPPGFRQPYANLRRPERRAARRPRPSRVPMTWREGPRGLSSQRRHKCEVLLARASRFGAPRHRACRPCPSRESRAPRLSRRSPSGGHPSTAPLARTPRPHPSPALLARTRGVRSVRGAGGGECGAAPARRRRVPSGDEGRPALGGCGPPVRGVGAVLPRVRSAGPECGPRMRVPGPRCLARRARETLRHLRRLPGAQGGYKL